MSWLQTLLCFTHLGYLFGYRGEELILLLLYSHFNYKLSFYSILMSKYHVMSSFPIFFYTFCINICSLLGLDSYYFETLRHLNLLQVLWPDICLHAPSHFNVPKYSQDYYCGWIQNEFILGQFYGFFWMNGFMTQKSNAKSMMFNCFLLKKNSWTNILLIIHYNRNSRCQIFIKNIEDLKDAILYLELAFLWP